MTKPRENMSHEMRFSVRKTSCFDQSEKTRDEF